MVWTGTTLLFHFACKLYVSVISGHFVPTSISLSWKTVLSNLGKGDVPWVNFWFFIFLCEEDYMLKSFKCCVLLHIYVANGT